jgi:hypothetical protein
MGIKANTEERTQQGEGRVFKHNMEQEKLEHLD